jgi:hypothetical protein
VADLAEWKSRLSRDPWKEMTNSKQSLTQGMLDTVGVKGA